MGEAVPIKVDTDILLSSYIKNYLSPKYIFLPIRDDFKLRVIDNSYVYKNDIVMIDKKGHSVHSSISGRVLGVKSMLYSSGKRISSLVIENDFKENIRVRKSAKKYISKYDKKSFMELLEDTSLMYKGEYLKDKFTEKHDSILINGVELEPYFGNKYFLLSSNIENILETIDLLDELFGFKKIVLAIKNTSSDLVTNFLNSIGTYPNIELRLVNDAFPNGLGSFLEEQLNMSSSLILDIEEIVDIYHVLKKQTPITEKIITITGDAVSPKSAISVKIGSLLSEVFINNFDFTKECVEVHLNGIMMGKIVDTLKYVIDSDLDGIVISSKSDRTAKECINCGLCSKNCPRGLNPKYVFDHEGRVRNEYKKDCLYCGLCNYVCPANRDFVTYMKGENQ